MKIQTNKSYDFSHPDTINNLIKDIVEVAHPDKIILFGSRAMGTERSDSDYDICVLIKNIKKKSRWGSRIHSAIKETVPVDIIVSTPAEYEELKKYTAYVFYDIHKHGKVIYEK